MFVDVGAPWCEPPPLPRRGPYVPAGPEARTVGFFGLAGEGPLVASVVAGTTERAAPERLTDASAP